MTATVTSLDAMRSQVKIETVTITPAMATKMLEANTINRPLSDAHVHRIARQITEGKWKFNGDTIKIADTKDVVDGQHRLWAIIEASRPVETIIVHGVSRDSFATLDTIRKARSGSDILALMPNAPPARGKTIAAALKLLVSYQRTKGNLKLMSKPDMRVENSDVQDAFVHHPNIVEAVNRVHKLGDIVALSVAAFVFYIAVSRNEPLAEEMIEVLHAPAGIAQSNPFFKLRHALLASREKRKTNTLEQTALMFKALNAAKSGKRVEKIMWKQQGSMAEEFPKLVI